MKKKRAWNEAQHPREGGKFAPKKGPRKKKKADDTADRNPRAGKANEGAKKKRQPK